MRRDGPVELIRDGRVAQIELDQIENRYVARGASGIAGERDGQRRKRDRDEPAMSYPDVESAPSSSTRITICE